MFVISTTEAVTGCSTIHQIQMLKHMQLVLLFRNWMGEGNHQSEGFEVEEGIINHISCWANVGLMTASSSRALILKFPNDRNKYYEKRRRNDLEHFATV